MDDEVTTGMISNQMENIVEGADVTTDTQESTEKTYTEAELEDIVNEKINKILPHKIEKARAKLERENAETMSKYKRMESILQAGLETKTMDETIQKLTDFYSNEGVDIPDTPVFSERQEKILGEGEAQEIIDNGDFEELVSETNRLASKGYDNLTNVEKIIFLKLDKERKRQEGIRELQKEGISEKILDNQDYQDFVRKLNPDLSEKEKYQMYLELQPKPKVETIGSMKGTTKVDKYKDYYTPEEARRLTDKDLDDPKIMDAVMKSMQEWENRK